MRRFALLVALLGSSCSGQSYVLVQVQAAAGLPPVAQLALTASDGSAQSKTSVPATPQSPGISFPKSYVVALPAGASSLSVFVEGLDSTGQTVARGYGSTVLSHGGGTIEVPLTLACASSLDCDQSRFCAGAELCGDGGACIEVTQSPLPAGSACNPGGAGAVGGCFPVDGGFACLGFGVCGDGVVNEDLLPDGGIFQEQCDWGSDGGRLTDGGNRWAPGACRPTCRLPICGDGIVDPGEVCDLGADLPDGGGNGTNHGCNATCTLTGQTEPIAGDGDAGYLDSPDGLAAQFYAPKGIGVIGGTLYVADYGGGLAATSTPAGDVIRAVGLQPPFPVRTLAGEPGNPVTVDGTGGDAGFVFPSGMTVADGGLFVGELAAIRSVTVGGTVTTIAGQGNTSVFCLDGPVSSAKVGDVSGLALLGGDVYFSDQGCGRISMLDLAARVVTTVAPLGNASPLDAPAGVVAFGGAIFFTEFSGHRIRRLDPATGAAPVFSGSGVPGYADGPAATAQFDGPVALCADGRSIYVVDSQNVAIRQLDPTTGAVTTVAGGPASPAFGLPNGCAFDPATGLLYVSEGGIQGSTIYPSKIVRVR